MSAKIKNAAIKSDVTIKTLSRLYESVSVFRYLTMTGPMNSQVSWFQSSKQN
ncbi:MAG: hypothetical protein ACREAR_07710 [Nitrosotalea sp.]